MSKHPAGVFWGFWCWAIQGIHRHSRHSSFHIRGWRLSSCHYVITADQVFTDSGLGAKNRCLRCVMVFAIGHETSSTWKLWGQFKIIITTTRWTHICRLHFVVVVIGALSRTPSLCVPPTLQLLWGLAANRSQLLSWLNRSHLTWLNGNHLTWLNRSHQNAPAT